MTYSNPEALVSTDWLSDHLSAPDVRVVDASHHLPAANRDPAAEYLENHIPGAVFFDIDDMTDINGKYGYAAGDQLLRQIGGAIGGLVRAEDLPARFGGDKFCIVLPDSDQNSARPVLQRITGLINLTEFAVRDIGEPIRVHLQTGCAALQADDSAESLIARARADINHR